MLRLPSVLLSAIAGVIVVAGSAHALPENPGASGGGIPKKMPTRPIGLLGTVVLPQVQKELNLSDQQKQKIRGLLKEVAADNSGKPGGAATAPGATLRGPSYGELPRAPAMTEVMQQKRLAEILSPEQLERLKQLDLQAQGASALRKPEVIGALRLTPEQRYELSSVLNQANERPGGKMAPSGTSPNQFERELMDKALKVLTPKQRQTFEELKGKPIQHLPRSGS
jgi:Spy/CpxP family protein refolding chaperone